MMRTMFGVLLIGALVRALPVGSIEKPAPGPVISENERHHYTAEELVVFKEGMAHAEEVAAYKAAHPEQFTPEAVAAYKVAHPERTSEHHSDKYTDAELAVFKAGVDHYTTVVAPYKAAHPEQFTPEAVAERKAAHDEHSSDEHHHYTAEELVVFKEGMAHAEEVAAYKAAHPEQFTPEAVAAYKAAHPEQFTPEAVAAYKAAHPERTSEHHSDKYTDAELAVFKAGFDHYTTVVAPYKAAHPEQFTPEAVAERKAAHEEHSSDEHHHYTAEELVVFKEGMAHAEEVAAYKAAHPEQFTPEAVAAYKVAHPERTSEHHSDKYTDAELAVFKAGFDHYTTVVAPYKAAHPEQFTPEAVAERKAAHEEHSSDEHHHYTAQQ